MPKPARPAWAEATGQKIDDALDVGFLDPAAANAGRRIGNVGIDHILRNVAGETVPASVTAMACK
jgi:hypothetical protein